MHFKSGFLFFLLFLSLNLKSQSETGFAVHGKFDLVQEGIVSIYNICETSEDSICSVVLHKGQFQLPLNKTRFEDKIYLLRVQSTLPVSQFNILLFVDGEDIYIEQAGQEEKVSYRGSATQDSITKVFQSVWKIEEELEKAGNKNISDHQYEEELKTKRESVKKIILKQLNSERFQELSYYIYDYFQSLLQQDLIFKSFLCLSKNRLTNCYWSSKLCNSTHTEFPSNKSDPTFNDNTIEGILYSASSKIPIPFALVTSQKSKQGTFSNENGEFAIKFNSNKLQDTIVFYSMGYDSVREPIVKLLGKDNRIFLKEKPFKLNEITVKPQRSKRITLGIKRRSFGGGGITYSADTLPGTQIAHLIELGKYKSVILQQANIHIQSNSCPEFPLRVHIYKQDSLTGLPGQEVFLKENLIKIASSGWASVDLSNSMVELRKNFFVSFEWLIKQGCEGDNRPYISVKSPIKSSNTFIKYFINDSWHRTPQNYVINVLVSVIKK